MRRPWPWEVAGGIIVSGATYPALLMFFADWAIDGPLRADGYCYVLIAGELEVALSAAMVLAVRSPIIPPRGSCYALCLDRSLRSTYD